MCKQCSYNARTYIYTTQLQEQVALETDDNKVLLCRNKIMGDISWFSLAKSGYKETLIAYCCDHYLYEDVEQLCISLASSAIDPDFSHVKS